MAVFSASVYKYTVYDTGFNPFGAGGDDGAAYKRYIEYLESLKKIYAKEVIIPEDINEIKEIAEEIGIKSSKIELISENNYNIDYSLVYSEIDKIKLKIDALLDQIQFFKIKQKQDEEAALILLMCL